MTYRFNVVTPDKVDPLDFAVLYWAAAYELTDKTGWPEHTLRLYAPDGWDSLALHAINHGGPKMVDALHELGILGRRSEKSQLYPFYDVFRHRLIGFTHDGDIFGDSLHEHHEPETLVIHVRS